MTAEIAIVNRQAIALAADSAVTIGRERVWKQANKLFSLGPENDIAVMIYNNGEFAGFPWELVVKSFRAHTGATKYKTVRECGDNFIEFLSDARFAPDKLNEILQLSYFLYPIECVRRITQGPSTKKHAQFQAAAIAECDRLKQTLLGQPELPAAPSFKEFRSKHSATITGMARDVLKRRVTSPIAKAFVDVSYEFMRRQARSDYYSGVVLAGYGSDQMFPELVEYYVDGKDGAHVRGWLAHSINTNEHDRRKTTIMPFGQTDIFHLFMEGVSPSNVEFLQVLLLDILQEKSTEMIKDFVSPADKAVETVKQKGDNKKIVEKFLREFRNYRQRELVQPILDVVRALPKEEMAEMARALVDVTSLRRKVDSALESVGGPVDIAVISKGDGLIWIERKHYFTLDKNRDYLYRKFANRRAEYVDERDQ